MLHNIISSFLSKRDANCNKFHIFILRHFLKRHVICMLLPALIKLLTCRFFFKSCLDKFWMFFFFLLRRRYNTQESLRCSADLPWLRSDLHTYFKQKSLLDGSGHYILWGNSAFIASQKLCNLIWTSSVFRLGRFTVVWQSVYTSRIYGLLVVKGMQRMLTSSTKF